MTPNRYKTMAKSLASRHSIEAARNELALARYYRLRGFGRAARVALFQHLYEAAEWRRFATEAR